MYTSDRHHTSLGCCCPFWFKEIRWRFACWMQYWDKSAPSSPLGKQQQDRTATIHERAHSVVLHTSCFTGSNAHIIKYSANTEFYMSERRKKNPYILGNWFTAIKNSISIITLQNKMQVWYYLPDRQHCILICKACEDLEASFFPSASHHCTKYQCSPC